MKALEKLLNASVFVVVVFTMLHTVTNVSYAKGLESSPVAARVLHVM